MIAEASALPRFDEVTPKEEVLSIINSLTVNSQAMVIPLLPEKYTLNSGAKLINGNSGFGHRISFPVVPPDAAIKSLLETFNNRMVIAFFTRITHSHLYGTSAQPLLFSFSELHAPDKKGLKGFTLDMQGDTYGSALYFAGREETFPVINRGLAFELAGTI